MTARKPINQSGTLLEREEFFVRLRNDEIFKPGSWSENKVRYVGYDLTAANDYLILPKNSSKHKQKFAKGDFYHGKIKLEPGDTIFVSSHEKGSNAMDLYGNIGTKFYLLSKGVLLYTGLMIEPGLGLKYDEVKDEWEAKEDERFHFFLTNAGADTFEIIPQETVIATVQFFKIKEIPKKDRFINRIGKGNKFIEHMFFDEDYNNGVYFFKGIDTKILSLDKDLSELEKKYSNLSLELSKLNSIISRIENGSSQIMVFGVYLLSVTMFGVAFATILSLVQKFDVSQINNNLYNTVIGSLAILFFVIIVYLIYNSSKRVVKNFTNGNDK